MTRAAPEEYPPEVGAAVITALPGAEVMREPSAKMLPPGIVREVWARVAMLELEELRITGMELMALEGIPASSTTSTLTVPVDAPGRYTEGEVRTSSLDG